MIKPWPMMFATRSPHQELKYAINLAISNLGIAADVLEHEPDLSLRCLDDAVTNIEIAKEGLDAAGPHDGRDDQAGEASPAGDG